MRLPAALGSILVVLVALLSACGDEEAAALASGDVVRARFDDQFKDGRDADVTLPTGTLLINAAEPVDGADADETRNREAVDAPSGAVLVPITWQYDTWASDRLDGIMQATETPLVDLVSNGERYRLPPPERQAEGGESFYVVVDGDAEDRSLEIEFDGVTQTVDLTTGSRDEGEAAGLYDINDVKLRKKACDEEVAWFDTLTTAAEFRCDLVGPVLTPYAAGEWAPEGSMWLALTLRLEMRVYGETNRLGGGARFVATKVKVRPEIDDEDPVFTLSTEDEADVCPLTARASCGWSKHLIFEVPADDAEQGPLDVKASYRLLLGNSWNNYDPPRRQSVSAEESLKLWSER